MIQTTSILLTELQDFGNPRTNLARLAKAGKYYPIVNGLYETERLDDVKEMLYERFENIDYAHAREDVLPFIKDPSLTALWSGDFFKQITSRLQDR